MKVDIPTLEEAELLLKEAEKINPGPWVEHSKYVAKAAKIIAREFDGMDGNVAYILGYLHDIGRIEGFSHIHHIICGYNLLMSKGYGASARIALTHSFPFKDIRAYAGKFDCNESELNFIKGYLSNINFDDYDKLIQLCDALALPSGFCIIEKRMVDVVLRNGFNDYTVRKWEKTFEIQKYFEERVGKSIYSLLEGVVENTFNS